MKHLIVMGLSFCLVSPSWGAVAHNSDSSAATDSGNAAASPQTSTTMTVGSGANRALICVTGWDTSYTTPGTITVHWDSTGTNQSMTVIASSDSQRGNGAPQGIQTWGLLAPTAGNKTLSVAWTSGTHEIIMWCSDFTGVNQTSNATAFINVTSASGKSTVPAITITSNAGDMTYDAGNNDGSTPPPTNNGTQTTVFLVSGAGNANPWAGWELGHSPTNTHTYAMTSGGWAEVGVDIAAAAATGGGFNKLNKLERYE